jgi:proton-translocating NAD(P)+ transhydrogenase subunit beta
MVTVLTHGGYLAASILFILGLKGLTHPRTAVRGNLLSALGMLVAVTTVLASEVGLHWGYILAGVLAGGLIGVWLAWSVGMTAMPQLVALFNGFGGGASLMVAAVAFQPHPPTPPAALSLPSIAAAAASAVIGTITLVGSLAAFAKLQRWVRRSLHFAGQKGVNAALALLLLAAAGLLVSAPLNPVWLWTVVGLAALLGLLLVTPIGGADMPVVIAALNSYSGLAACATGFILDNTVLIVSGSLVGASGMILTRIMCRAMNRSFFKVIFGLPMGQSNRAGREDIYEGKIKSTSAEEITMLLEAARQVVIVPGYGMAVAQAQHALRDLSALLEARAVDVVFAIHPVAGRMPGHMNVLLAEANIPYDQLKELEVINPGFDQTDVTIVIGANDVVNPLARNGLDSPIAGMPILDVDRSKTVVVIKRSLSPGFAGIANPLFAADNALMFFEDGKKAVQAINAALKESRT